MSDPREQRLPQWARQELDNLRTRLAAQAEPLVRELAKLRPELDRLKARNEALTELLECAARGGHYTARQVVEVLTQYTSENVTLNDLTVK